MSEGSILQNFPSLHAYNVNFKQLPGLKEYLVTCQDKDLVFNGGIAKVNGKLGFWIFTPIFSKNTIICIKSKIRDKWFIYL